MVSAFSSGLINSWAHLDGVIVVFKLPPNELFNMQFLHKSFVFIHHNHNQSIALIILFLCPSLNSLSWYACCVVLWFPSNLVFKPCLKPSSIEVRFISLFVSSVGFVSVSLDTIIWSFSKFWSKSLVLIFSVFAFHLGISLQLTKWEIELMT